MMKEDNYEVECISYPDDKDWLLCKQVTLNTVGKNTTKLPTESFKRMILQSEHSHIMYINAQELMQMSRRRLCRMASPETRHVMTMIVKKAISVTPELDGLLVPMCEYRNGLCSEPNCCGYNKIYKELNDENI